MRAYLDAYGDYQDALRQFGDELEEFPEAVRPRRPRQPVWLSLYLQCQRFHTLLVEGGLLDQPVEAWQLTLAAGEAYEGWLQERQQAAQLERLNDVQLRHAVGW